ncbi:MAG: glycosyltransferase [Candidatus Obscuribacterales bacterium]|nr:glycosyltransferase [Candidatus Obscuribacterales bacterium]
MQPKINEYALKEELNVALKEVQTLKDELSSARRSIAEQNSRIIDAEAQARSFAARELHALAETESLRVRLKYLEVQNNSRLGKLTRNLSKNLKEKISLNAQEAATATKISELGLFDEVFYVHRYPEILDTGLEPLVHYLKFGGRERKDPSGLFDTSFYLKQVNDADRVENALVHYVSEGAAAKLNPNRLFESEYYLRQSPDASSNALAHFAASKGAAKLSPSPYFDLAFYGENNPDVVASGVNLLEHYLVSGAFEGRDPNLFFDSQFYLQTANLESKPFFQMEPASTQESLSRFYSQAAVFLRREKRLSNPLIHYIEHGEEEGLYPHPLFSPIFYKTKNITPAKIPPLKHFLIEGRVRGYRTHPLFDANFYLEKNNDVAECGVDAFSHFLVSGFKEKRSPHPLFDTRYYLEQNADVKSSGVNPLIHFLQIGAKEGRNPSAAFDIDYYVEKYRDAIPDGANALIHYVTEGARKGFLPNKSGEVEVSIWEDADPADISFQTYVDSVDVSIVVPSYKQNDFTLRCLKSLATHQSRYRFEVIVVDDCSPDDTEEKLSHIVGLRYFKNSENMGFVMTCNRGVAEARGEFVALLNNDTIVLEHWLDELIDTFYTHPKAGLVGSKLIYPDGALQDAGSIVYSDGDAANFGRDDAADKPEYNYVRAVDYCTGAALAMRREHYLKLGGFGEEYRPIYWEDVDLAFKVRRDGFECLYQPFSVVIHFEGVTCGRNTNTGLKQKQILNQKTFGAKWASELPNQPKHTNKPFIEWNRDNRRKVLFVTCLTPQADRDAGSTLTIEWLKAFKNLHYDITFFPTSLSHEGKYTEYLQKEGIKCIYAPYVKSPNAFFSALKDEYDLVVICRIEVFDEHFATLKEKCPSAKFVFQTIDLHYLRTKREAEVLSSPALLAESEILKEQELSALRIADMSIVVSPEEVEILKGELPNPKVMCIPFSTQIQKLETPFEERRDLVFVGGYGHQPNADAVVYFAKEVFPLIKMELPEVRFFIIGGGATEEVKQLANFDIVVTGMAPDLTKYLKYAKLSVAPLRFGAGLKGKILSSLGAGLPCVATNVGLEGTGLTPDENILVANSPQDFAKKVVEVYRNKSQWQKLAYNGYQFVERNFSPEKIALDIKSLLMDLKIETS